MKKQINPPRKAHVLRSALILLSLLVIYAIPFALAQSRSSGTKTRSVANRLDGSKLPAKNINSLEQSVVSPVSLPSIATHETWVQLQDLVDFRTASEITPPVAGFGAYSDVTAAKTEALTSGLIINPHYESSVPQAMRNMIERNIIPLYESLFSDPITIDIFFRYSDKPPSPEASPSPFPPGVLATSFSTIYTVSWNDFISALRADARTSNDNVAIASLPPNPLSTNVAPSSANGRAVGFNNTPPALFADGTLGPGGPYDGIVTLNSAAPFWFSRPLVSGSFDAQRAVEHEMNEIMGLGSYLNRNTSPCTSYEAESPLCPQPPGQVCTVVAGGAVIQSCPNCSGGADVGFIGNNSGTLQFNQIFANASGRLDLRIWYANGDTSARNALLSVNGGPGRSLTFPPTGSFQTVGSIEISLANLVPGGGNTLEFYNPIVGHYAPDIDRIEVVCTVPPPASIRPQDLFSWSSPGVRNLTSDGSRYFSIDSGNTNIVNFNQTPPGDFGDWFSEPCPQRHSLVQNAFVCPDQFADISATSPEGINLDVIGYDLGVTPPYLANLSTRAFVQTGDNVMIGGLIVEGTEPKRVILRAIGPALSQYGIPNAMANPTLELHNANGALIASNDDWQHTIIGGIITGDQVQDIQSSGHAPGDARESAIIANLSPGNYTAIVRGVNNTMGVALVESYDLSPSVHSILSNISTRSRVETGDEVMIGGFIVQGNQPKNVIIRAIGRELNQYGIPDFLADPTLELHNGNGALIASNNNWQQTIIGGIITQSQVQDIQNSGHAPTDSSESAIVANLPPGNYTAIVRGVNNTTGVALVEVYDLH